MVDQFTGGINELSAKGIDIDRHRDNRFSDILLEGFEQIVAQYHHEVPCRIGIKTFEGQLLMQKEFPVNRDIFECNIW